MSTKNVERDAREVFDLLRRDPNFPSKHCVAAARYLYERGYPIISGDFKTDNSDQNGGTGITLHFWNYDPKTGNYIDITCSQFNKYLKKGNLPDILIISPKSKLVKKLYKEFKRDIPPPI